MQTDFGTRVHAKRLCSEKISYKQILFRKDFLEKISFEQMQNARCLSSIYPVPAHTLARIYMVSHRCCRADAVVHILSCRCCRADAVVHMLSCRYCHAYVVAHILSPPPLFFLSKSHTGNIQKRETRVGKVRKKKGTE